MSKLAERTRAATAKPRAPSEVARVALGTIDAIEDLLSSCRLATADLCGAIEEFSVYVPAGGGDNVHEDAAAALRHLALYLRMVRSELADARSHLAPLASPADV